ncbi:hypothetical protein NPIL_670791 [Nephila pilipes]|uniref:Uncharacterized protein n=1 Tax=Nephila pilipes TaxID=299642 RepID=A0A8X6UEZ8_NEPPI|nr:hypothetical protein NPIL_670791 [Nephila pilipes]
MLHSCVSLFLSLKKKAVRDILGTSVVVLPTIVGHAGFWYNRFRHVGRNMCCPCSTTYLPGDQRALSKPFQQGVTGTVSPKERAERLLIKNSSQLFNVLGEPQLSQLTHCMC